MKKSIKLAAVVLAAAALTVFTGCKKNTAGDTPTTGILSLLNMTEENYAGMRNGVFEVNAILLEQGYRIEEPGLKAFRPEKIKVRYYDTLQSLLMALKAGEIGAIGELSQTTAAYLCAKDPELVMPYRYDFKKERKGFSAAAFGRIANGFSFMMLQKNSALRDQFNAVIAEMQKDGSLDSLIENQIVGAMDGKELTPIIPEYEPGRQTIKVAVTGDLPPMDYVAADGTFAGFNTALLSEIGKRLDKNIAMVQVSSVGRATALASGTVDVAFWTRSSSHGSSFVAIDSRTFRERIASLQQTSNEKENRAMLALTAGMQANSNRDPRNIAYDKDMPEGTILTEPYFVDMPVVVILKK